MAGNDGRLISETEQTAAFVASLRFGTRRFNDIGDDVETESAIGTERNRHIIAHVEQIAKKQIAVFVERQAGVAACGAQVVVIADDASAPGGTAVETHGGEHARRWDDNIGDDDDIVRVGGIDGDRLFGFVVGKLAYVNVFWCRRGRGKCWHGYERECD